MQSKFGNQFQRIYKNRKLLKNFVKTTNVFFNGVFQITIYIIVHYIFTPQDDEGYCDLNVYADLFFLFLHYPIRNYSYPSTRRGIVIIICVCVSACGNTLINKMLHVIRETNSFTFDRILIGILGQISKWYQKIVLNQCREQ